MATINTTNAQTFVSGDEVTPTKLNALGLPTVTVSDIVNADISASAAIAASKLAATLDLTGKTVTLPATSVNAAALATSAVETLKINNAAVTAAKLSGVAKDGAGADLSVGNPPVFGCRAFVVFDGTKNTAGAVSSLNTNRLIRSAGNVSSVLRTAEGKYTITFTTPMPDAHYAVSGTCAKNDTTNDGNIWIQAGGISNGTNANTATECRVVTTQGNNVREVISVMVAFFR
jgi:hypothetical protein